MIPSIFITINAPFYFNNITFATFFAKLKEDDYKRIFQCGQICFTIRD